MLILNDDGGDGLSPMGATWSTDVITDQNEEEKKRKDKAYERDESLECCNYFLSVYLFGIEF